MDIQHLLIMVLTMGIPLIFAITLHEAAHGFIAKLRGDNTAYNSGRVTLNPVPHIDPIGTLLIPGLMLLSSATVGMPFIFGWAKPVPVDYRNLKNPRVDSALVALAGPVANLLMAVIWAIVFTQVSFHPFIKSMAGYGVIINIVLMILNLLPIPPLDGSRIVTSFLSPTAAYKYNQYERYGFIILLALCIIPLGNSNILFYAISPIINTIISLIFTII